MSVFTLDTSPFADGYMAAIRAEIGSDAPFSDEALALILKDCAGFQHIRRYYIGSRRKDGVTFWLERQAGKWSDRNFPPLVPTLSDAGKIELKEQGQ